MMETSRCAMLMMIKMMMMIFPREREREKEEKKKHCWQVSTGVYLDSHHQRNVNTISCFDYLQIISLFQRKIFLFY